MKIISIAALVFTLLLAPPCLRAQDAAAPSANPSTSSSVQSSPSPPLIAAGNFAVVPAPKLIILLPDPPPGWKSDKPEGSTSESAGFPITTASRVYVKGDTDNAPTATVNIIDSANNLQFQGATKAMWGATSDTPEGYDKSVTVHGLPGFEHYSNIDQTGVLWVVVGSRFFVQVETTRLPATELQTWLSLIDLKKLSTLK